MSRGLTPAFLLLLPALAQQPDIGPFPKASPERAFSELKVYDSNGSPLRKAREDCAGARQRVVDDAQWGKWLTQRRAEVDDWMARRKDKVEWVAGWWHDFVSPRDGSFLTFTPDEPGSDTLSSPSDARVALTPKIHGGWVFVFRSRHTDKMVDAARLFRLTGESRYAEWVADQLDFYADNYLKWPIQTSKSKSRLMHQSLDDANVLIRFINAARLIDGHVSAERRQKWIGKLFRPEAELLDETLQRIHNIACFQRSAMALAAVYARDAELWKRAVDGPFGIRKQVEHGITSDYLWFEQSFGYNTYVVNGLMPLFLLASLEGRAGELEAEMHSAENIMLSPILLRFPNGQTPNPADATGGLPRVPNAQFLASVYRVFPTHIGLAHAAKVKSWDTLVDPPEPASVPDKLPEVTSQALRSSQMAVLRSGKWQVFLHYGQIHASHAQAEALNYEAFFGDTDITHDAGTVGYGSPLHSGFYRTGAAHNVPLVNRLGQERWRNGELRAFEPARAVAAQPQYRSEASASRDIRIDGNKLIDTVTVELGANAAAARLGNLLHLQGAVEWPGNHEPVDSPLPYWTETKQFEFTDRAVLRCNFGGEKMRITIEVPGTFTLIAGRSPDVPPAKRDSLLVEINGTRAVFRTIIEPE